MTSANSTHAQIVGLIPALSFTLNGLPFTAKVHVLEGSAIFQLLLGKPFEIQTRACIQCAFFGDLTNCVFQAKHDCGMIEIKNNVTVKIVNPGYNVGVIRKLPTTTGKRKPKKVSEKVRPVAMRIPIDKAN
ncbi:hypothetical protein O9G_006322 [Rozella allomycis CSF55]|uniref:Uncharacterized protein n=1 Tax=Rozella allomycis (strain CSF55) TaxID=988480 RepID=A0A075AYJ1_ROZAC|nr:hypothetical protein O9G_006322 [Rozella allomycis CSF55]|eukprot:EPZ35184.1 hypothetical protein O9G_006322 [Rozella allomycis CSF55]